MFCAGVQVELHELPFGGSNLPRIQGLFCLGLQGLYELLNESNLPQILERFCVGVRGNYTC